MSTPTPEVVSKSGSKGLSKHALDPEDEAVDHFLARIQFFRTPYEIAEKILSLNQELGEDLIETQLAALAKEESDAKMIEVSENEISRIGCRRS